MTRTLIVCDYPCGKGVFRQCVPGINSHIQPFGAAKTIKKSLLSFIARLLAGLPGIITLKNSVSTQPVYKVSSLQIFFCKLNF